jgi:hypothetical protein
MALDLESLRTEIISHLTNSETPVFHAAHRAVDPLNQIYWDVERYPDYRAFLSVARNAGVKLLNFYHQTLAVEQIDEALDELEDSELPIDEKRQYANRLKQLREYEGFTCSVELWFSLEGKTYVFEQHTEWYESLTDILAELEAADEEEDASDDGFSGYFSNN